MRECYQYPKDPLRISQGEEAATNIRSIVLVMLALLVPLVVFAMNIGGSQ